MSYFMMRTIVLNNQPLAVLLPRVPKGKHYWKDL